MSTDQPPPGSGSGENEDPYRKRPGPTEPGSGDAAPPPSSGGGEEPPERPPPGPPPPPPPPAYGAGDPSSGQPPPQPPPYGEGYGGYGAPDPRLEGMPPLGGSGRRLVARIIDALLVGIPMSIILSLAGLFHWTTNEANEGVGGPYTANLSASLIIAAVYFLYEGYMLSSRGQTFGKKWMHIRVAMLDDGSIPSGAPGWIRAGFYSLVSWLCCLFWLIDVLWHLWDKPFRQCLHDKVARTVVVSAQA